MYYPTHSSKLPKTVTVLRTIGYGSSEYQLKDVTDVYDLLSRQPKVENGIITEPGVTNIFCHDCMDYAEWCPGLSYALPAGYQPIYGAVGDTVEEVYPTW